MIKQVKLKFILLLLSSIWVSLESSLAATLNNKKDTTMEIANELSLFEEMGVHRGLDIGQTSNFSKIMEARYQPTENFRNVVISNQLGDHKMLDYESGNGFGRTYLMSNFHTQEQFRPNFATPETTLKHLNSITMGEKPIIKPSKLQVETATNVLTTFDTPEKIMQAQTAMGLPADGVINEQTTIAAVNYLSVFGEKEFKNKVKKALPATQNYSVIVDYLKSLEVKKAEDVENFLHIGQETKNEYNNNKKGVANTTRYGVIEVDYKNSSGALVKGFPRKKGESDIDHAVRFYKQDFEPKVKAVKDIEKEPQTVVNAVASVAWNLGKIPENFDLANEAKTTGAILNITTTGGKHSNGVINRYMRAYNILSEAKGWAKATSIKTIPDSKDANKYSIEFYDASGKLIYKDPTVATSAEGSKIKPNYNYTVVDGALDMGNGTLLAATPKVKTK
jgi:hypothetical protein